MNDLTPGGRLNQPGLRPLWQAVHDRLSSGRPVSRVRVGPLGDDQREAIADLLGLDRLPDVQPLVQLAQLETVLGEICGRTVREVVADIIGPVEDRAAERMRQKDEREALWAWLGTHQIVRSQPVLADWVAQCRNGGLIDGSIPDTRDLLASALSVLAALPAQGEPMPVFAARVLGGDSHGLDDGTRLSSLVLRALSTLYATAMPDSAGQRRALWGRAGVADDELSATVLAAGLRPTGGGTLSRVARICAEAGQAFSITLAQLRAPGEFGVPTGPVHITENPSLLALALRRFGSRCPPLVCTSGWPNSAAIHLLRLLANSGASLRYHGDFDGEGIRIAAYILAKTPAVPWRMTAADYLSAVIPGGPSAGKITEAPWDPTLALAMAEQGTAVVEELVADALLEDLSSVR